MRNVIKIVTILIFLGGRGGIAQTMGPAAFFASMPQSSAVISNLGVLPLAIEYGSLKLKAVWGPAMLTNPPADPKHWRQHVCRSASYGSPELRADTGSSGNQCVKLYSIPAPSIATHRKLMIEKLVYSSTY